MLLKDDPDGTYRGLDYWLLKEWTTVCVAMFRHSSSRAFAYIGVENVSGRDEAEREIKRLIDLYLDNPEDLDEMLCAEDEE